MPRMQLYLPGDLYDFVKDRGLPASELLQKAVRAAVDALVVAFAEPDGTVLTGGTDDLAALAQCAERVRVERI